jgi:AcrR family transcriptional regulator
VPKILGGSLAEHRAATRQRLFEGLAALMRERGFDAVTLSDIAARAGVGRTAVYNHFASKESLLLAYVADQVRAYVTRLEHALDLVAGDWVAQLRIYVAMHVHFAHTYQLPGIDLESMVSQGAASRLRGHDEDVRAILRHILAEGVKVGTFTDQNVDIVVSLIDGCLTGRQLPTVEPDRSEAMQATEDFILRAVGAQT